MALTKGAVTETAIVLTMTWMHKDLAHCDELFRDAIVAIGFGFWNLASAKMVIAPDATTTEQGYMWIIMISGMIYNTMAMQFFAHQRGARRKERHSISPAVADELCRWMIVTSVIVWTSICVAFWNFSLLTTFIPVVSGGIVIDQYLNFRRSKVERSTWRVCARWTIGLYAIPLIYRASELL